MTNYERLLQGMTLDRFEDMLMTDVFCAGTYMDLEDDDADCTAPDEVNCRVCIRSWLEAEAE